MNQRRIVVGLALVLALVSLVALLPTGSRVVKDPEDLRAFYCGGQIVAAHADPYRAEPIATCEAREIRAAGMSPFPGLSLPAPLPPFALVPFGLLGLLPFAAASTLYVILLVAVMAVTAILVSRMTAFPLGGTIAALVLSDGLVTVLNGQIFPFALLALCACAFELQRGRPERAGLYVALAAIEPHVALPAIASVFWCVPRSRARIAISLIALAAISLIAVGIGPNVEYLLRVLPAHARSESASGAGQYSLTALLFHLGVARESAIQIGNVQFAATCVLGIVVARKVGRNYVAPELFALIPPAFAVLGGPFIHLTQMAVTIPALLALSNRIPKMRVPFGIALALVTVPWQDIIENGAATSLVAVGVIAASVSYTFWRPNYRAAVLITAASIALCAIELAVRAHYPTPVTHPAAAIAAAVRPGDLAEPTWEAFIETTQIDALPRILALHVPTWLGTMFLIVATTIASRRKQSIPV